MFGSQDHQSARGFVMQHSFLHDVMIPFVVRPLQQDLHQHLALKSSSKVGQQAQR